MNGFAVIKDVGENRHPVSLLKNNYFCNVNLIILLILYYYDEKQNSKKYSHL